MPSLIPKRVALLLPTLQIGGAEKVLVALANYLSQRFQSVELVLQERGPLADEVAPEVSQRLLVAPNYRTYTKLLSGYFDTDRPDFVITSIYVTGLCAVLARFGSRHKPKILIGAHNLLSAKVAKPDNRKDKYLLAVGARLLFPRADAIVCVSRGVANDLLRLVPVDPEKLHVVYNPVIPPDLARLQQEPVAHEWLQVGRLHAVIVTVGRLVPQKGFDTLLRALARLGSADVRLVIVGDGPERRALEGLAKDLDIPERVDFVGVDRNPFKYLARCDLFVMSSRWEGFGNTLVEALVCGCPVVATDCQSGPSEILENGRYGRLVPVEAVEQLAAAMRDALSERSDRDEKSRRIARAQIFNPESSGAGYVAVLRKLAPWLEDSPANAPARDLVTFVTSGLQDSPKGGREMLTRLNYDALRAIYGDRLNILELPRSRIHGWQAIASMVLGHIDGVNPNTIRAFLNSLKNGRIACVFLDGSNLGALAAAIKRECPNVSVCTFFHNVEARFFLGALRVRKGVRALAILVANFMAERKAVSSSDKRICLSERDSLQLVRLYGRGATHIAPMALQDSYVGTDPLSAPQPEPFALFVGGTFYANQMGIRWYRESVAPRAEIKVVVIGRGFENLREALDIPGKLEVVGGVEHLGSWYASARFVVAPIFDGSGMKTKVAEAMMHGKKVVGTPEAFSGYEDVVARAGWVCSSPDEFLRAMSEAQANIDQAFDAELRHLYLDRYSFDAARVQLSRIMEERCWSP
jgi:glycosyltransferase involved in cell wall biosynthesis